MPNYGAALDAAGALCLRFGSGRGASEHGRSVAR
jgi:hypothetical protein